MQLIYKDAEGERAFWDEEVKMFLILRRRGSAHYISPAFLKPRDACESELAKSLVDFWTEYSNNAQKTAEA